MPDIQTYWVGGPLPEWARQGLLGFQQQYPKQSPDEQRNFWVLPSRIGPNNTGDETLRQMSEAADAAGFQVKIIYDHLDEFAADMTRYDGDTLRDIIKWEMGNKGEISVKDLTNYMVLGKYGGMSLDLSIHRTTTEEQQETHTTAANDLRSLDNAEFKVPMLAEEGIMRHIGNPSYSSMSRNPENEAERHDLPHLDVWATYARPGSKGQEVMRGAAEKMVGNYADLVNQGIKDGKIVTRPGQNGEFDRNRFMLAVVNMETELGAKWNPRDDDRKTVIGHFAMSSLYDSIHGVYGEPKTPTHDTELGRVEVSRETWDRITWRTAKTSDQGVVVADLGITKQYQNSWRQPNNDAVTRAMVSNMRLPGEQRPPGFTTPPPGTSTQSSPTPSAATTPPSQSPRAGSPHSR
ncbi:hypothetical protein OHT93_37090 [Streptomyces sp. NBC_00191]|uniref:hypothetical protein n=1 Tax=Streptomyces sp. NBC_00191 TaxID=2975674 RepID=UPI00324DA233